MTTWLSMLSMLSMCSMVTGTLCRRRCSCSITHRRCWKKKDRRMTPSLSLLDPRGCCKCP